MAPPSPDWTDILTAVGTVATAIAAVGIAIWSDQRISSRVKNERDYQQTQLADERKRSDQRLAVERARSDAALAEERQRANQQQQLAEARAVLIFSGLRRARVDESGYDNETARWIVAIVINRGTYAITNVAAQFNTAGTNRVPHGRRKRLPGYVGLDADLARWLGEPIDLIEQASILTPADPGLQFESGQIHVQKLTSPYPVIRWTDRWETRWELARGDIRKVPNAGEW